MADGAAVLEAASLGDAGRLASLLRGKSRDRADVTDENGCSALQRAAADGHVEAVRVLLQHGANPNLQDFVLGNTACHEAGWKGYSQCLALLAAGGASMGLANAAGFSALHLACQRGHNQAARELLLANAPPDAQNDYGDSPLHTAARYGHAGVTRILISARCKVSEQNKNGDTALHIAAAMGRRKLTRILLEAGCDKSVRNRQGETARDIATRKELPEIIQILNTPIAKQKKKDKRRDESRERSIDEVDDSKKKDKTKKKKNVHFEKTPAENLVQWSPYGCHYYPDPKFFPKPKLGSLPPEPLQKGEQYYLDLAGNIKKGPVGSGYTCYCAPFFKHMEEKLNEDKKDLKRHIDRAHERLDQKVTDLEIKTKGHISELTRYVAAERAMCKERHQHLEHWLTRGMVFRASERVRRLDYSPKGSLDIPPMKRTRSLELLDPRKEWNKVNNIINNFNKNSKLCETNAKETSKSTDFLDCNRSPPTPRRKYSIINSLSRDHLDASSSRASRSPTSKASRGSSCISPNKACQNVTAEIHVKSNRLSMSRSPSSNEIQQNGRYRSSSRESNTRSPSGSNRHSEYRISDSEVLQQTVVDVPQNATLWKSQVLQRTADDIRKRDLLNKEVIMRNNTKSMDISQDGYVKLLKQGNYMSDGNFLESQKRKSVQELVAQVEIMQRCQSPEPNPILDKSPTEIRVKATSPVNVLPNPSILKMPQQPQRPAPILKEKPPKSKRFSLHNLIPFPTRKAFQTPPKDNVNDSESSDDEDTPNRTTDEPGPMRNANLLQTLPLPNFETFQSKSATGPHLQGHVHYTPDLRAMVPKDAYFHEIPNRHHPHTYNSCQNLIDYNETGLPSTQPRNRNPLPYHQQTDAYNIIQGHLTREKDRVPQCYSDHLNQNAEVEIANQNDHFRNGYYDNQSSVYPNYQANQNVINRKPVPDHNLLHSRLQSLAINTHLTDIQSQADRESHNDSGYSTKVYGSSQGPSPSLSGHVENCDNFSGQRVSIMPNGKTLGNNLGTSSLV